MKLRQLIDGLPGITVKGSCEIDITHLTAHAQSVAHGNLFVVKGRGRDFVPEALSLGAVALLIDRYDPSLAGVTQVITDDVAPLERALGERFYRSPSRSLFLVGVTGTNGKTTTSYLIERLFASAGLSVGLMGSIERKVAGRVLPAPINTPDLLSTQRYLRAMVDHGQTAATMEVSSHGLAQGRAEGIDFDVAIFTNLTQDHLDFHGTMEAYALAKHRLFEMVDDPSKWAIVNVDDPSHMTVVGECRARRICYGIHAGDLQARDIHLTPKGIAFTAHFQDMAEPVFCPMVGRFNVYNCLAALGVALARGLDFSPSCQSLASFTCVPGRMERVPNERGIHVFVDYSHTEDALENALKTLRELNVKRIYIVFGCGGDRDCSKRPKMGRIASQLSDYVIITTDNPRSEDPERIIDEIASGIPATTSYHIEVDRRRAIHHALMHAEPGDAVLIAGKGHETYQIFAHETIPFDDRLMARVFLDPKMARSLH